MSLRRGPVTGNGAAAQSAELRWVAEHTGHRDLNVMRRYYRKGMVFKGNPAKEIGL
jgi:hypothetical protein